MGQLLASYTARSASQRACERNKEYYQDRHDNLGPAGSGSLKLFELNKWHDGLDFRYITSCKGIHIMARLPRLSIPGCPQHVIQRGNNRQACFFADQDYSVYLDKLKDSAIKHNVEIHAFVLMTNHVHLLMTASSTDGISQVMQNLGRYYVRYINQTYQRTGTLWEGRFKSTLVDSEKYLLTLYRYIELNPVRANMVAAPSEYPWSSYHANAGDRNISLITPHGLYLALGNNEAERKSAYQSLFVSGLSENTIQTIRNATNKAWVLGDDSFIEQVSNTLPRRAKPSTQGGVTRGPKHFTHLK